MKTAKKRKPRIDKRKPCSVKAVTIPNPAILPAEELRQLVFQIIHRDDIKPFIRRMVILLDALRLGQTDKLTKIARQSKDPTFLKLISAVSSAVNEGELVAARITLFLAAGYAYQESFDYLWDFMRYLDGFRQKET
jgi:hypothetical protein